MTHVAPGRRIHQVHAMVDGQPALLLEADGDRCLVLVAEGVVGEWSAALKYVDRSRVSFPA